jgi:hypothetical protein
MVRFEQDQTVLIYDSARKIVQSGRSFGQRFE